MTKPISCKGLKVVGKMVALQTIATHQPDTASKQAPSPSLTMRCLGRTCTSMRKPFPFLGAGVQSPELNLYLVGGVSAGCAAFTLLTLCLVCRSRRRRRRRRRRPPFGDRPPLRPPPPSEVPAMHFVSVDTV